MSRKEEIGRHVLTKIRWLHAVSETGSGKANMAELRKGVGKFPGELPSLFGMLLEDMPESFLSKSGVPTKEEWACYIALTLFSWHQQGNDVKTELMHTDNPVSVGNAARQLKNALGDANADERMIKKLRSVVSANDVQGFSQHLRCMIKMLADKKIRMNYAMLAKDIYEWQFLESRNSVNLRWGQDYYKQSKEEE